MVTAIRQASSSWNGRAFFRRPIRNPISVAINLLTYMRRKLDQDPFARDLQDVHARVNDAIRKLEPVFAWTAGAEFNENHYDGLKAIGPKMEKIVFAKFGDPNVRPPCLGLHDVGIKTTEANCQFTLLGGLKFARQIEMQIRHEFLHFFRTCTNALTTWVVACFRTAAFGRLY